MLEGPGEGPQELGIWAGPLRKEPGVKQSTGKPGNFKTELYPGRDFSKWRSEASISRIYQMTSEWPELPLCPHPHPPLVPPQQASRQESQAHGTLPRQGPSREQARSVPSPSGAWTATGDKSSSQQCRRKGQRHRNELGARSSEAQLPGGAAGPAR